MTLTEIKENNLRCVIKVDSKEEAVKLFEIFNPDWYDANYAYNYLMGDYRKRDGTVCFSVAGNKIDGFDTETYFKKNEERYGKIYRFKDLIAKEGIVGTFKGTPVYATGGVVSIHDLSTSEWYNPMRLDLPEFVFDAKQAKELAERLNKELAGRFNAFPNNGISAKNGGKNSMKFTFYVTEGTRVDKSCNGTIPTMTTMVSYIDKYGCIMKGTATCDKADYDERQGVLEALANATCGDNFYKAYAEAIKFNRYEDELSRTCAYCGQLLDTREEREEHEAWHVERKKARRGRYLLRKRAKEIAFEEQAQKMAKEIIAEDNKK